MLKPFGFVKTSATIIILVFSLLVSGCALFAIGAGAGAGYKVATDERPAGEIVDDSVITSKIKVKLLDDPNIKGLNIDVDTYQGKVTLNGVVRSQEEAAKAMEIAQSVNGVKSVNSNLQIKSKTN